MKTRITIKQLVISVESRRKVNSITINRLRNRSTSGALAWNVVNNPLTGPTGCATRLLLGVNRLLDHRVPGAASCVWLAT